MAATLSQQDDEMMDRFLGEVFDEVKSGKINRKGFIAGIAHVMAALDAGNSDEAIAWFKAGAALFQEDDKFDL